MNYPKRLIEVDLPIKRISAHARREKSIRHGHISTLHIWWARRPLAACRAVICAALWPDPADPICPQAFRDKAAELIMAFARKADSDMKLLATSSEESKHRWAALVKKPLNLKSSASIGVLRGALLDFIADFANWDNSTVPAYLETSRALTQAAHEALGGAPGTRPLVVDPFCGGGSIPLEALRVGADTFASDLNPIPVLLNKVILEYIPKYGQRLADEVRKWGAWIKKEAEKELAEFYPKDPDGATPIAYLWARTIQCEGPGCGAEVPLIRSLWLAKKANRSVALQMIPRPKEKRVDFEIVQNVKNGDGGTVARGSATCPCCGYTTRVESVRKQLKARHGGANDARLLCVVTTRLDEQGRFYRLPTKRDLQSVCKAHAELDRREKAHKGALSLVPDERISMNEIRRISVPIYGMESWGDFFTDRQLLALTTLSRLVREVPAKLSREIGKHFANAVQTCLSLIIDKVAQYDSSLCRWKPTGENVVDTFGRQALGMVWDFAEANPYAGATGDFLSLLEWHVVALITTHEAIQNREGTIAPASATCQPCADDIANSFITDPPYYDAIPYSHLSDFFYVWLRRNLGDVHPDLFKGEVVPKDEEIVVDRPHKLSNSTHDIAFYERELTTAFAEGRRVLRPDGVGTIVFASKTTASWEAILKAVVDAGWIITGSWPIDTEMETRVSAQGQARLASSVHLVCRPRENPDGSVRTDEIGDWRGVLAELPRRIHDWMPRLAEESVVGADAIFACLGPALEIFSRYSRVEKASGEVVPLREYLEHVWAAVSHEALSMIFAGASTEGFEPDARLTAMWLWTLNSNGKELTAEGAEEEGPHPDPLPEGEGDDEENGSSPRYSATSAVKSGFVLEYDAARKIAQGLGAHLEQLTSVIEVKGDKARLLPVAERTKHLFGKDEGAAPTKRKKKKPAQKTFFDSLEDVEEEQGGWGEKSVPELGNTVLDRIHQSMILFAAGRSEALKRFLVEDGVGRDARYWRLAQALSALYPTGTDEKRWVDGVLARKKGLGF